MNPRRRALWCANIMTSRERCGLLELRSYPNPSASIAFNLACVPETHGHWNPRKPRLRSYPDGFGRNLLGAYEEHLGDCPGGRRDLRFKPQFNRWLSEREQFDLLPLGDTWEEAGLFEVVEYIWTSKKLRPESDRLLNSARIPAEWEESMSNFYRELRGEVGACQLETVRLPGNGGPRTSSRAHEASERIESIARDRRIRLFLRRSSKPFCGVFRRPKHGATSSAIRRNRAQFGATERNLEKCTFWSVHGCPSDPSKPAEILRCFENSFR